MMRSLQVYQQGPGNVPTTVNGLSKRTRRDTCAEGSPHKLRVGPKTWRLLLWLPVWLVVGVFIVLVATCVPLPGYAFADIQWFSSAKTVFSLLYRIALSSLCIASILCLLNLPFMVLVFACPLYRDRFCRVLDLSTDPPALANPPSEAILGEPCELT